MTMKTRSAAMWLLFAGLLGLAGCSVVPEPQADLTRYYVLTGEPGASAEAPDRAGLKLGLRNVTLPPYLDKGSIVIRRGENELAYNDYARWAEPLSAGIARLVREQLLAGPRVGRVFTEGFPFDQERDYDVAITIHRCEGVRQGEVTLARFAAVIEITAPSAEGKLIVRRVCGPIETPWDGRDYGALVRALSEAVGTLGGEILAALPAE